MPRPAHSDLFDASIDSGFQRRIVRLLIDDYARAKRIAEELFAPPEFHDALGVLRRAFIEQDLRSVASRYSDRTATPELNRTRTSHHTKIVTGRIVLTESALDKWTGMAPEAKFRNIYADVYQPSLFGDDEPPPEDGLVYGVIVHAPDPRDVGIPAFIEVRFPNPDWSSYADQIDLLGRFQDLKDELRGDVAEPVAKPSTVLRPAARRLLDQKKES